MLTAPADSTDGAFIQGGASTHWDRVISGQASGLGASVARAALAVCSSLYSVSVRARNRAFDAGCRRIVRLPVPVISVGNLTVGGTGKTPLVVHLCELLLGRSMRVAVLARGYGARRGEWNDELQLIARRYPEVVCIADPDRVAAGRRAIAEAKVDVIVLDDGFQHRRLARDLDLLTLDATEPFGFEHLLPRGRLREPVTAMRRADMMVVTHADRLDPDACSRLSKRIRSVAGTMPVVTTRHRPIECVSITDGRSPVRLPPNSKVTCFCSIARPESFARTVREMGYIPVALWPWPDHHTYTSADIDRIANWARQSKAEAVLTTEKDAAKLVAFAAQLPDHVLTVRIAIDFSAADATMLAAGVENCLRGERV